MNNSRSLNTHVITGVGIFTAIVIVLQLLGAFIRFGPFSIFKRQPRKKRKITAAVP